MTRLTVTQIVAAATLASAARAALAQDFVTYTLTWSEVLANSNQPVTSPNGVIEPGEGVRIAIRATITPGIGATATYSVPPPPGIGTIAGYGYALFDLLNSGALGGMWSNITRNAASNPGGVPGGGNWSVSPASSAGPNGEIYGIGAGQFVLPGSTAQMQNPVHNLWRGTWTPAAYNPRLANFWNVLAYDPPTILIEYARDANGDPLYVGKFVTGISGGTGNIPIVPSPGVVPIAGVAVAGLARRRRVEPPRLAQVRGRITILG